MFEYTRHRQFFAACARGLEPLLADELRELGAEPGEPGMRGVSFKADTATLYRVVYATRLASRVLAPMLTFDCHSDKYLYQTARKIDWDRLLDLDRTFVIDATVSESNIDHSQFAAQRLKDAVCDHFREKTGQRPSVDKRTPDLRIYLHLRRNRAVIGIDVGGGALHRRGYRTESVEAPLQETLAAAIVRLSGWDAEGPLHDPMCGSGTLLAEAVLHATRTPAGWLRAGATPPWKALPDFDPALWTRVKAELDGSTRELPKDLVSGADVDGAAVRAARTNLSHVPGGTGVHISRQDARELTLEEPTTVLANPPYGVRLGVRGEVEALYKALGDALKRRCTGTTAFVLCGDLKLVGKLGLEAVQANTAVERWHRVSAGSPGPVLEETSMPQYVAFLRGINVGGHRVKMDRLRELFQDLGLSNVSTFIASGNVIFSTDSRKVRSLEVEIERHLAEGLGYGVPTFLRTPAQLREIVTTEPSDVEESGGSTSSVYVILLQAPAPEGLRSALESLTSAMDEFRFSGTEIYWRIQGKVSESPFLGGDLERAFKGTSNTMRNLNTLRRLLPKLQ